MQVFWDDIPDGVQRRIFGLEKEIHEIGLRRRLGATNIDEKRAASLEARVDKLTKPYYRP